MLSPIMFIKNNKKRTAVIIVILILSVFTVNFVTTMIGSLYETCEKVNVEPFSGFSIITRNENVEYISEESVQRIEESEYVSDGFSVLIENISIDTVFGTTSSYIFFMNNQNDLLSILEEQSLSIVEGRLPEKNQYEIALHRNVAKNKGLKIGDSLDKYDIVGILKGKRQINVGSLNVNYEYITRQLDEVNGAISLLIMPKGNQLIEMNREIDEMNIEDIQLYGWNDAKSNIKEEFSTIHLLLFIVILMVSISLSIAVAALAFSVYANRYDEFGILYAIGYKKKEIQLLIFKELLLISFTGWLIGYVMSLLGIKVLDHFVYSDMGQTISIFNINGFCYTIIIPILMFICTIIPVSYKLYKTDLISIIEGR